MLVAAATLAALWLATAPAGAATTTTTQPLKSDEILNGVTVSAATVTTPGLPNRKLTADQAAAFLRTWLPTSIVQRIQNVKPAACLPVSTLHLSNTFSGVATPMTVLYASDGTSAWVGMPAQALGFASVQSLKWIPAPDTKGTIDAFNAPGAAPSTTNDCASATPTTGTTTNSTPKPASGGSSSSKTWVIFVIIAVIVVAGGIWLFLRSRSRARAA